MQTERNDPSIKHCGRPPSKINMK